MTWSSPWSTPTRPCQATSFLLRPSNALYSCNATIGRHIYANMVSITTNDNDTGSAGALRLATSVARP
jgi:hypothetical protein